jgi:hypothetical protein
VELLLEMSEFNKPKTILPKLGHSNEQKKPKKRLSSSPISFMNAISPPVLNEKPHQNQYVQQSTISHQAPKQSNSNIVTQSTNCVQPTSTSNNQQNLEVFDGSVDLDALFSDIPNLLIDSELEKLYNDCSIASSIPVNVLSSCINYHISSFLMNPSDFYSNCL